MTPELSPLARWWNGQPVFGLGGLLDPNLNSPKHRRVSGLRQNLAHPSNTFRTSSSGSTTQHPSNTGQISDIYFLNPKTDLFLRHMIRNTHDHQVPAEAPPSGTRTPLHSSGGVAFSDGEDTFTPGNKVGASFQSFWQASCCPECSEEGRGNGTLNPLV